MVTNFIYFICSEGYYIINSQEMIDQLMKMDAIKLFAKNEKEIETLMQTKRIDSKYVGIEFSIEKHAMLIIKSGKI